MQFYDAYVFNQDISGWDVSMVTNMQYMVCSKQNTCVVNMLSDSIEVNLALTARHFLCSLSCFSFMMHTLSINILVTGMLVKLPQWLLW